MQMARVVAVRVTERLGATGVNLLTNNGGDAWQLVPHFHVHVIPRYPGDPLRLPWDPVPAIPASLSEARALLRAR
jgi:histidine triad (HIT) family protein